MVGGGVVVVEVVVEKRGDEVWVCGEENRLTEGRVRGRIEL